MYNKAEMALTAALVAIRSIVTVLGRPGKSEDVIVEGARLESAVRLGNLD
jgi:hypothetical protein